MGSTFVGGQERRIRGREELICDIVPTKTSAISEGAHSWDGLSAVSHVKARRAYLWGPGIVFGLPQV